MFSVARQEHDIIGEFFLLINECVFLCCMYGRVSEVINKKDYNNIIYTNHAWNYFIDVNQFEVHYCELILQY